MRDRSSPHLGRPAPLAGSSPDAGTKAAGLAHGGPYATRHTFASCAIAAGLPTFEIATTTGTSLEQMSKTYAHLLPDSADRARVALDAFLTQTAAEEAAR